MITADDIARTCRLARLNPMDDIDRQCSDFDKLLGLLDQINAVSERLEEVEPLTHPIADQTQPLRDDKVTEHDRHTDYQALAPQVGQGVYLVPPVLDDQSE